MFTGLVKDLGTVTAVDSTPDGVRIGVRTALAPEISEGDSVAVNGVCLTATRIADGAFAADVMHETLRRSSLAEVREGTPVNLELPLRPADRLGGHVVQGHVDGLGTVAGIHEDGFARVVEIAAPPELLRYVVEKGSIAVDGVSLTLTGRGEKAFSVSIIPHTYAVTTIRDRKVGEGVNLESDLIARYVAGLLEWTKNGKRGLTEAFLRENGF